MKIFDHDIMTLLDLLFDNYMTCILVILWVIVDVVAVWLFEL